MIDIHMHLIFGVDDGAKDLAMSIEMLKMAAEQGITAIVTTYHSDNCAKDNAVIKENFKTIQREIIKNHIPIDVYFGCEVFWATARKEEVLQKLESGINATMNGTKYVLVEFWPDEGVAPIEEVSDCIMVLKEKGYIPILAHVERYKFTTVEAVRRWKTEGACIQVNAYSVKDEASAQIRNLTKELLTEHLVDITGSDGHRLEHRPPCVKGGIDELYAKYDKEYVDKILYKNAQEMLGIK